MSNIYLDSFEISVDDTLEDEKGIRNTRKFLYNIKDIFNGD